jgi:hypothetical protein
MEKVTRRWRKLDKEELHNFYSLPDITTLIKSRRIWWAARVARTGAKRNLYKTFCGGKCRKETICKTYEWMEM